MSIINKAFRKVFPTVQAKRVKPWFAVKGDRTLRLNYDLNEHSVVFDMGGYEGQWASDIYAMYNCRVLVFEPFPAYYQNIKSRFSRNSRISVFDFGLSGSDQKMVLYAADDATSSFKGAGTPVDMVLKKATPFIKSQGIQKIDLIKINIEGGEYDLLDELIHEGTIKNITNIQVQFHDFVDNAVGRMKDIQRKLSETHELTYQYEFVWENWKLKSAK